MVSSSDSSYNNIAVADVSATAATAVDPRAVLSIDDTSPDEGDDITVTVSLVGGSAPSSLKIIPLVFDNVSAENADYTGRVVSVTVPANERSASATLSITDDNVYEAAESFTVALGALPAGVRAPLSTETSSETVTIAASDKPEIGVTAGSAIDEGGAAQFTISASNPADKDITVGIAVTDEGGYAAANQTGDFDLTLDAGDTSLTRSVTTTDTAGDAPDGSITLTLDSSSDYTIKSGAGSGTVAVRDTEATTVTLSAPAGDIAEAGGSKTITITLGRGLASGESLSLPLTIGGVAALGTDFTVAAPNTAPTGVSYATLATAPTVTFTGSASPSAAAATLIVTATSDSVDERDEESVSIGLPTLNANSGTGLSGGATGSGSVSFNIEDDDAAPSVSVRGPSAAVTEGASATFTFDVTGASDVSRTIGFTVRQSGSYVDADDLGAMELTLASGVSSLTHTVPTVGDNADEAAGSITVTVNAGAGYTVSGNPASVVVNDNDPTSVTLSAPAGGITEAGGSKTVTITLGRALVSGESLSLPLTVGGTATLGTDYQIAAPTTAPASVAYATLGSTPTVTFTGGTTPSATSATLTITATNDGVWEGPTESITLALPTLNANSGVGLAGGASGSGSVNFNIDDDDASPTLTVTGPSALTEGGKAAFTITATYPSNADTTIGLTVSQEGSFLAASALGNKELELEAGETEISYELSTQSDTTDEPGGSVTLALRAGSGYDLGDPSSVTFTVADDDATSVTLGVPAGDISETGGTKTLTVTLGRALVSGESLPVALNFTGTATLGTDYTIAGPNTAPMGLAFSGLGDAPTVTFTGPSPSSAAFTLSATGDSVSEGDETITVRLAALGASSGTGLAGGATGTGTGTFSITDDDTANEVGIAGGDDVVEGGSASFTISSSTASTASLTVNLSVTASGSFVAASQLGNKSVVIPANARSAAYTVPTLSDTADETSGSVTVTVTSGTGYTISSTAGADTVDVSDDDPTSVTLSLVDGTATEGDGADTGSFRVQTGRALASGESLDVPLIISGLDTDEYSLALTQATGVALSGTTVTFTGASSASATATITFSALADSNLVTDAVTIAIPASSSTGATRLTATGLDGGAIGTGTARITIADAGAAAGVTLSPTSLTVKENESTRYSIRLNTDPGAAVTITPSSNNTDVTLSPASLSFTSGSGGNWSTPQFITVTAGADGDVANDSAVISHAVSGYPGVTSAPNVTVSVTDAGHGFVVEPASVTLTAGGTGAYTLRLLSRPSGQVRFVPASDDTDVATVTFAGAFTRIQPDNWQTGRTVTVNAVAAGTATVTQAHSNTQAAEYASLTLPDVGVTVLASTAPQLSIAADAASVSEAGPAVFTVTSTVAASTGGLEVTLSGAQNGDFATAALPTSVTIAENMTTASVSIATTDDSTDEPNGSISMTVEAAAGYGVSANSTATVAVTDNDATAVTLSGSGSIAETGGEGVITVTLARALATGESLAVPLSIAGGATLGTDYTLAAPAQVPTGVSYAGLATATPGITFTGGSQSSATATLRVVASADTAAEINETISVALGTLNARSGTGLGGGASGTGTASFSIADDDGTGPTISISGGSAVVEGTAASFTVSANPTPAANLTVNLNVQQDGAFVAADDAGGKTVTLAGGSASASYPVATQEDNNDERDGSVTVRVLPGSGYRVSATMASADVDVNDDDATGVTLSAPAGDIAETGGKKEISVTLGRSLVAGESLIVPLTIGGGATRGADYTLVAPTVKPSGVTYAPSDSAPTSITFTGGASASAVATLSLAATSDSTVEPAETVTVAFGTLSATMLSGGTAPSGSINLSIIDDDSATVPEISIAPTGNATVSEGGAASFTVSASPAPSANLSVSLTVTETGSWVASTNLGAGKTVTIPSGAASAPFTVATVDDNNDEVKGSVEVTIASGAGYKVSSTDSQASVSVDDNDPTSAKLSGTSTAIPETGGSKTVTVTLGRALVTGESLPVTLTFDGAATFGADFTAAAPSPAPSGVAYSALTSAPTITFTGGAGASASATLILNATSDIADEGQSEDVIVELATLNSNSGTGLAGGASGSGSVSFNITDDDGTPVVSVSGGGSVVEGTAARFTFTISPAPQAAISVSYAITDIGNFIAGARNRVQAVSAGVTSVNVDVATTGDTTDEVDGSVTVTVTGLIGYEPSATAASATVMITDDDATTATLSAPDATATESDSSQTAQLRIALNRALVSGESMVVPLQFSGGTIGTDFTLTGSSGTGVATDNDAGTVTFTGGTGAVSFATFTLTALADVDETNDTISVSVGSVTATGLSGGGEGTGTASITVTDAGPQPAVDILPLTLTVTEGSTGAYNVKLHTDPGNGVTVTVTPRSGTPALATVSGALSFTGGNSGTWNANQPVTITAPNDTNATNDTVTITHTVTGYGTITTAPDVTVTITDRGYGVTVTPTTLSVDERASATYEVSLHAPPSSAVIVTATSGAAGTATVNGPLTFTPSNWQSARTITVTGVEAGSTSVTHGVSSSDTNYSGITPDPVRVTVTAIPRVRVSTTSVTAVERGENGSYTLVLNTSPGSGNTVTVTPATSSTKVTLSGAVTFDENDWSAPKTVTVTAVNDEDDDNHTAVITHSVTGYGSVASGPSVNASITDAGNGLLIEPGSLQLGIQQRASFTITLLSRPTQDVAVVTREADDNLGQVPGLVLVQGGISTFSPSGSLSRTITISGAEGGTSRMQHSTVSTDSRYSQLLVYGPTLTVSDKGVGVDPTSLVIDEGGDPGAYNVRLFSDPGGTVTVTPSSNIPGAATVSGALTFTSSNWAEPQKVTVTPVDDDDARSAFPTITHSVSGYSGVTSAPSVSVTVNDDEDGTGTVTIVESDGDSEVTEAAGAGHTDSYTIVLDAKPDDTVIITITSADAASLLVSGPGDDPAGRGRVDFTTTNWNSPQVVTLTAVDDAVDNPVDNRVVAVTHAVSTGDPRYNLVDVRQVDVTVVDDDVTAVTPVVNFASATRSVSEAAGTTTANLTIAPAPASPIAIAYTVGGTAASGADYTALTGSVTASAGTASIPIAITNDNADEPGETLILTLTDGDDYDLGTTAETTITITDDDATPVTLSTPDAGATEGDATDTAQIQVTLGRGLVTGETLNVPLSVTNPDAAEFTLALSGNPTGVTFASASNTLTFTGAATPSATTATLVLTAPDETNATDYDDETLTVGLGTLVATGLGGGATGTRTGTGVITIADPDVPTAGIVLSSTALTVKSNEDTASYTIRLGTAPASDVELEVDGGIGRDYTLTGGTVVDGSSIRLVFTPSNWSEPQKITVTGLRSGTDNIEHVIRQGDGGDYRRQMTLPSVRLTITHVPPGIELSETSLTVTAINGTTTYRMNLATRPQSQVSISVYASPTGSATARPSIVEFPASDWNKPQTITITGNRLGSVSIEHAVSQSDGQGGDYPATLALPSLPLTVGTPVAKGTLNLSFAATSITEGGAGANFGLAITGVSADVSVDYSTLLTFGGSAATADYSIAGLPAGSSTFTGPGYSQSYATTAAADNVDEPNETLEVTFGALPNTLEAGTTASILIVDANPTSVTLARTGAADPLAEDGSNAAEITVSLGRALATGETVTVPLTVTGTSGTVTDADYAIGLKSGAGLNTGVALSGQTLTMTSGAQVATLEVRGADDDDDEGDGEAFTLGMGSVTSNLDVASGIGAGGTTPSGSAAIAIADDDDNLPVIGIAAGADVTEGTAASFTLNASPAPTADLDVSLTVAQEGDFVDTSDLGSATVTIAANQASANFTVDTELDSVDEPNGAVTLTAVAGTGYRVSATDGEDEVAVADDDATPVTLSLSDATATEGDSSETAGILVTLGRALASGERLAAPLTFAGGAAGTDFSLALTPATGVSFARASSTITFTGGAGAASAAALTLTALADADDVDDTLTVNLGTLVPTGLGGGVTPSRTGDGEITVTDPGLVAEVRIAGSPVSVTEGGAAGEYTLVLATDPGATVTVTPSSGDPGAVTVSGALSFDSADWDEPKAITVTPVDDADIVDETVTVTHTIAGYAGVTSAPDATVNVSDRGRGVQVDPGSLTLPAAGTASYSVVLLSQPTSSVTVTPTSNATGAATVGAALTFAPAAWNIPQTIEVTGVAAGSASITHAVTSSDAGYAAITPSAVAVTVTAAAGVSASEAALAVTERGDAASYTLVLNTNPGAGASVTVTPTSTNPAAASVSGALTFNEQNWSTPQIVTVTPQIDNNAASESVTIAHAVTGYTGVTSAPQVAVSVTDFGHAILVEPTELSVPAGETATYALTITTAPSSAVTVTPASGAAEIVGVGGAVTLTAADANAAVTVDVSGVATGSATIAHTVASQDSNYGNGAVSAASVAVEVTQAASVRISPSEVALTEGGEAATYDVVLGTDPGAAVAVTPTSGDPDAATVSGALSFNSGNWNQPQQVTVTPVDDADSDDETLTISHAVTGYPGVASAPDVEVTVADDDRVPVVSIATGDGVTEGGNATFTVSASPAPENDLAVELSVAQQGAFIAAAEAGAASVTIAAGAASANYTLATQNDSLDEPNGALTATLSPPPADAGYLLADAPGAVATLAVYDNDATGVTLTVPSANIAEAGGSSTLTIELSRSLQAGESLPVPLTFAGTATLGDDYTLSAPAPAPAGVRYTGLASAPVLTFTGANNSARRATLTLTAISDGANEGDGEAVSVSLGALDSTSGSGLGGGASGIGGGSFTIEDDDEAVEVDVSAIQVDVDDAIAIDVTASLSSVLDEAVIIPVTVSAEGAPPGEPLATAAVTIPAGQASAAVRVELPPESLENVGRVVITLGALPQEVNAGMGGAPIVTLDRELLLPEVRIAAGGAVTEGGNAVFTVSADPAPDTQLTVQLDVADAPDSDFLASGDEGAATVTIPASGSATFTLATVDDEADEPDGVVTVTVSAGEGYRPGSPASASATVREDDAAAVEVAVGDASAVEGPGATLDFSVTMSPAASAPVTVDWATRDGTATAGADYVADSGTLTFAAGETEQTISVAVLEDDIDEGRETMVLRLSGGSAGARLTDPEGQGTIHDPQVAAAPWLGRFGRTVSEHVFDGVRTRLTLRGGGAASPAGRMGSARSRSEAAGESAGSWMEGTIAGARFGGGDGAEGAGGAGDAASAGLAIGDSAPAWNRFADWNGLGGSISGAGGDSLGAGALAAGPQGDSFGSFGGSLDAGTRASGPGGGFRNTFGNEADGPGALALLLSDASFDAGRTASDGGQWGVWGRGAASSFEGVADGLALDGDVVTGQLGLDYSRSVWTLGLSVSHSEGEGIYERGGGQGEIASTLTALTPYVGFAGSRVSGWAAASGGNGDLELTPRQGMTVGSEIDMTMQAIGIRGDVLVHRSGFGLAILGDVMASSTESEAVPGLPAVSADTERARLALESSWTRVSDNGGAFSARLEAGVRNDRGNAEEGVGGEVAVALAWSGARVTFELEGRTLVSHDVEDFKQSGASIYLAWDGTPESSAGPSASLRQRWGIATASGVQQLFDSRKGYGASGAMPSLDAEIGWGLPAFGQRFFGSPYLMNSVGPAGREQALGWRLEPASETALDLNVDFRLYRRESLTGPSDRGLAIEAAVRW